MYKFVPEIKPSIIQYDDHIEEALKETYSSPKSCFWKHDVFFTDRCFTFNWASNTRDSICRRNDYPERTTTFLWGNRFLVLVERWVKEDEEEAEGEEDRPSADQVNVFAQNVVRSYLTQEVCHVCRLNVPTVDLICYLTAKTWKILL